MQVVQFLFAGHYCEIACIFYSRIFLYFLQLFILVFFVLFQEASCGSPVTTDVLVFCIPVSNGEIKIFHGCEIKHLD